MWLTSLLVEGTQMSTADDITAFSLSAVYMPILPPRALLVHILAAEDALAHDAYRTVTCFAVQLDHVQHTGVVSLLPVLDLTLIEQATIRRWLIVSRWPAWARADHAVRKVLGVLEAPVLLAAAARHYMIPLPTLAKAALEERLPTMRAGDRQLVYLSTVAEAQERKLLHHAPGRPRRS